MSDYNSDEKVVNEGQDHFRRYDFAKRVASSILDFKSADGLVVGIYGKWGEGKTSLLEFIERELEKKEDDVIVVHFNPWRFGDEASLIRTFFHALAEALKAKLYTKSERTFSWLQKKQKVIDDAPDLIKTLAEYGDMAVSFVKPIELLTKVAKSGKSKSDVDVETLKKRIEQELEKKEKRVVIVVDDIDRLDWDDTRAIFRLVKLTGNFKYITYLLAFDDLKVADVLAQGFGKEDNRVGMDYLEKIVQVPLRLPSASQDDINSFLNLKIKGMIGAIRPEELERLNGAIRGGIAPALKTPRMAVRFANACSFSMPLMKGVANEVDLILVEGLKLLFPELYQFVKANKNEFISVLGRKVIHSSPDYHKEFEDELQKICGSYSENSGTAINLVRDLFPESTRFLGEPFLYKRPDLSRIDHEMRICADDFFDRYFSYSLAKGELSEVVLTAVLNGIGRNEDEDTKSIKELFEKNGALSVINKIELKLGELDEVRAKALSKALGQLADFFPRTIDDILLIQGPDQLAQLILSLVKKVKPEDQEKLLRHVVNKCNPKEFGFNIVHFLGRQEEKGEPLFKIDMKSLREELLDVILQETAVNELPGRLPLDTRSLLAIWKNKNNDDLEKYLHAVFSSNPGQVLKLIKACTPYKLNLKQKHISYSNFDPNSFSLLISLAPRELVAQTIVGLYGKDYENPKMHYIDGAFEENSDENLLKQFMAQFSQAKDSKQ